MRNTGGMRHNSTGLGRHFNMSKKGAGEDREPALTVVISNRTGRELLYGRCTVSAAVHGL